MTYLKLNWNLPGANELNKVHCYFLKTFMIGVYDYLLPSTKIRTKGASQQYPLMITYQLNSLQPSNL